MDRRWRTVRNAWAAVLACAVGGLAIASASAAEVLLKDGRVLSGKPGDLYSLAEQNTAADPEGGRIKQILVLDDELRRTFVSKRQVQEVRPDNAGRIEEKFKVRQPGTRGNSVVKSVGPPAKPVGNFDEFGRRTFTMQTARGPLAVIQAITEITPRWVKVEGINYVWDMRLATSTIPHETLHQILLKQVDPQNIEHRKKIARFYLQSERYDDARRTLEDIVKDFPQQTDLKQQLEPTIQALRQSGARRLLGELRMRRGAGQHRLVEAFLKKFPSEDVEGEILQAVREMIQEYEAMEATRATVVKESEALVAKIDETITRQTVAKLQKEIAAELNVDTLPRMAAFMQNLQDPERKAEEKMALAISGWVMGADNATTELSKALSACRVRELIRKYLTESVKLHRGKFLHAIPSEEGASAAGVANLVLHMKPPFEFPEPVDESMPGYYKLEVIALPREPPVAYYVQLPPEYNPHRRYPLILTLHGLGMAAEQQIDWWAGGWSKQGRLGQATRHGYIVLAPEWTVEHQTQYQFSAREHAAVLNCLRDACRRFSVDTDRVFLSGYSAGGDAAWDLGLSHPDLWAGVIPIAGESQRYCMYYWRNAKSVPFYVVGGELDGARMVRNARDLDRYLQYGYNTTVVEYLGRGHEAFPDELLRLFDWMERFRRDFFPREFTSVTMRQWDNFFWWAEVEGLPPGSLADPGNWPPPRSTQPIQIEGFTRANNYLTLRAGTKEVTVWLAPQMVDFKGRIHISVGGRRINLPQPFIHPSIEVLLEDVRSRGDRQHPFWAKVEVPSNRVNGEP